MKLQTHILAISSLVKKAFLGSEIKNMGLEAGAHMPLVVAAVLSADVFGSHVCFYSDATILTSSATGCNNFDHAYTQAGFGILAAIVAAALFLIAGFVFA